jgi:acyl-CoA synthetase (AMP-forming)/AMP-acid ligase II
VWVSLNPRNGLEELNRIIDVTDPSVIVFDADCADKFGCKTAQLTSVNGTHKRANEWQDPQNYASTGRATLLTQIGIMDGDGQLLGPDEMGKIVLSGDLVMTGYYKVPDKTAETVVDGWLHTGDIGYIDSRGYVFIKDRIRDVVITGGFNV